MFWPCRLQEKYLNSYTLKREEGWKHSVKSETCPKLEFPPKSLSGDMPSLQKWPEKRKELTGYGTQTRGLGEGDKVGGGD